LTHIRPLMMMSRPSGSVIANEVFSSGVLLSEYGYVWTSRTRAS
jgi:hypothetical protein